MTIHLAAILRLANAFDATHDGHVRKVGVENAKPQSRKNRKEGFLRKPAGLGVNEALVIGAEGFTDGSATAQAVAAERYVLETVLRRPIVVRAITSRTHR
jgi:hypothetical protein